MNLPLLSNLTPLQIKVLNTEGGLCPPLPSVIRQVTPITVIVAFCNLFLPKRLK